MLFGEDIRLLSFSLDADPVFTYLNIVAIIIFSIEIVLRSVAKKDYLNSFFFWLDMISTISIISDIDPIWAAMVGEENSREN